MPTMAQANLSDEERRVLVRWLDLVREELDVESVWLYAERFVNAVDGMLAS